MTDLFSSKNRAPTSDAGYNASHIEVLEGLEPVRRRPGMYIGGTDENALHHMAAEVFDNAMDEAVAGYATRIEMELKADGSLIIKDNGRGIPTDQHPKFPDKSALEVIMTSLHSGGKFGNKVYKTSGGLHGVGLSVVNALSDILEVEVTRNKQTWKQTYSRGAPTTKLEEVGTASNKRGTIITFHPDKEIFGKGFFRPKRLYEFAKSKAYLFKGVEIRWSCDPVLIQNAKEVPTHENIHFPKGLVDYLSSIIAEDESLTKEVFSGETKLNNDGEKVEWAICWSLIRDGFSRSYCNTIYTPLGGGHENGFRSVLVKGLKSFAEMIGNKKAAQITADDVLSSACVIISVFIHEPEFQGQTKERLVNAGVSKPIENVVKDHFDHWLTDRRKEAEELLEFIIEISEERLKRRQQKETSRKNLTQRLRLPGKLTDCSKKVPIGTEIFLVEGDSAGGSAKQARNRETQAILPLRGKILNVASGSAEKISANQGISDIEMALGCGVLDEYDEEKLRYEKVIIMTDADVDGAHIAALLMTYFYCRMPELIAGGHLYLAKPPLYRVVCNNEAHYASNDKEKDAIVKKFGNKKIDVSRFKGLGEMTASQLKETTMHPKNRIIEQIKFPEDLKLTSDTVECLMGKNPELRFKFIQDQALSKGEGIIDSLDV